MPRTRKRGAPYEPDTVDKEVVAKAMGVFPDKEPDVYAFLLKALETPLPKPWTEHADKKGRVFYWNPASRHSSWSHPLSSTHKTLIHAYRRIREKAPGEERSQAVLAELDAFHKQGEEELEQWRVSHAPDGTPYYYKSGTQQTRWDNPRDELISHQELRICMLSDLLADPSLTGSREQPFTIHESPAEAIEDDEPPAAGTRPGSAMDVTILPAPGEIEAQKQLPSPVAPGDAKRRKRDAPESTAVTNFVRGDPMDIFGDDDADLGRSGRSAAGTNVIRGDDFKGDASLGRSGPLSVTWGSDVADPTATRKDPMVYQADNTVLQAPTPGIGFRNSPNFLDMDKEQAVVPWGSLVRGVSHDEHWLKVGERYLPKLLRNINVLRPYEDEVDITRPGALQTDLLALPQKISLEGGESRPTSPITPLLTPTPGLRVKDSRWHEDYDLVDKEVDLGWVQPDEIALHLGMNFEDTTDQACFAILRPIFTADLPMPWQGASLKHGRTDFFHAGVNEMRKSHPLFMFFNELYVFLREQVVTDVPITEPMSAAIFCEASPQCVRNRLGVWEGPIQDPGVRHSRQMFERLIPGRDEVTVQANTRGDDPRAEAAANVVARLDAWHHLWKGFAPEEPFPLLVDRVPALAAQLSESVVVAPGNRADKEWVLHQWNWQLDTKAPVDKMLVWTTEEAELQPEVAQILGHVFGKAMNAAAAIQAPDAKDEEIAFEVLRMNYRIASTRIEEEEDEYDDVEDEFEEEKEEEEYASDSEYSEDLADEPGEDSKEDMSASEEDMDSLSASGSSAGRRRAKRRKGKGGLDDIGEDGYEDEESEELEEDEVLASEDELKVDTPDETPPPEVGDFLGIKGEDQTAWADFMLRPLTPTDSPREKENQPIFSARSLPQEFLEREKKGFDQDTWGNAKFLKTAVIKPYIADLGWRCHVEITHGMWSETDEAAGNNFAETTSPKALSAMRSGLLDLAQTDTPFRETTPAPLDSVVEQPASPPLSPPASPSGVLSPKSPGKTFRGLELPPVALDQVREHNENQMNTFRDILRSSNAYFDASMSGRGAPSRPMTPLVNPAADAEVWKDRVSTRPALSRPSMPVREKLRNDDMSLFTIAVKGSVPPAPSPSNQARAALPVPKYLLALDDEESLRPAGPKLGSRPSSAQPSKANLPRGVVHLRSSSADARARRRQGEPSLLPKKKRDDALADMAAEEVRTFLMKKVGRMESVMTLMDTKKCGYITREEFKQGLQKLEYNKMELADQIFTSMDKQNHYVLTLSDLQGRGRSEDAGPKRDPVIVEGACLLQEVVDSELQSALDEAMFEVLGVAMRSPMQPLDAGLPDVQGVLLKRRELAKAKKQAEKEARRKQKEAEAEAAAAAGEMYREMSEEETSEEQSDDSDPEASILRELRGDAPGSSKQDKDREKERRRKKRRGKLQAAGRLAAGASASRRRQQMRAATSGSGDDTETDGYSSTGNRTGSPGSRPGSKARKVPLRTVGILGKLLARKQKAEKEGAEAGTENDAPAAATGAAQGRSPSGSPVDPSAKRGARAKRSAQPKRGPGAKGETDPASTSPQRNSQSPTGQIARGGGRGQGRLRGRGGRGRGGSPNSTGGGRGRGGSPNATRGGSQNARRGGGPNARRGGSPNAASGASPNARRGGSPNAASGASPNARRGGSPNARRGGSPNAARGGSPNAGRGVSSRGSPPGSAGTSRSQKDPKGRARSLPQGKQPRHQRTTQRDLDRRFGPAIGVKRRQREPQINWQNEAFNVGPDELDAHNDDPASSSRNKGRQRPGPSAGVESPTEWAMRMSAMSESGGKSASGSQGGWRPGGMRRPGYHPDEHLEEDDPHASYDIGFHSHDEEFYRRRAGMEPWTMRRPEDVCKTYGHIFKLLNDPHLKKRVPQQKQAGHVSLPRLPEAGRSIIAADAAAADQREPVGKMGGHAAKSAPDLTGHSTTAGSGWRAGSAMSFDTDASTSVVTLPPLAKSAPSKRQPPSKDPLGRGPQAIYAG